MSKLPVLYSFRRCPYAMRARLALYGCGVQVELREILLRDKPQALIDISPKATTPTMLLPDGHVLDESLDIIDWALEQSRDPKGWRAYPAELDTLIDWNDGDFKHALDRYKYITRYPEDADGDWRAEGEQFLAELEVNLVGKSYLAGERPTLPDYAIFPFIRQFRMPDTAWFDSKMPYPNVRDWLACCVALPEFTAIMHKFAVWAPEAEPIVWPN